MCPSCLSNGAATEEAMISGLAPGAYALSLETAEAHLTLHIDRHGVRVRSVEVGV